MDLRQPELGGEDLMRGSAHDPIQSTATRARRGAAIARSAVSEI
jgi:hypothetical protein